MGTIIDALVVTLGLDSSDYQKGQKDVDEGLDRLKENAESTAKEMEARGKQAAQFVSAIKTELVSLFALVTAGKGLSGFISESIAGTAALGRFASDLNMSARELDGWGAAAEAFGGTAEGVRGSLQHIAGGIQQFAMTGQSELIPVFRSLGVAVTDSSGKVRDYREIMLDVADKLKSMSSQEALSFGKMLGLDDGTITLLRQSRAAVTDLTGQMTRSSGITEDSVAASQRMQKNWAIVNQQFRGIGQTIYTVMAPAIELAAAALVSFSAWIATHHDAVVGFFTAAAGGAAALALATIGIWGPIVLISGAIAALSLGVAYLWDQWKIWTNGGSSSLGGLFQFATDVANGLRKVFEGSIGPIKELFASWLKVAQGIFKLIYAVATGSADDIRKAWKTLMGDLGNYFGDWVKVIENLAPKIAEAIIKAVKGAWDYIKGRYSKIASLFSGESDGETPDEPSDEAAKPGDESEPVNTGKVTRGVRNNNPGNLNFAGQAGATMESGPKGRFAKFETMEAGLGALARQLKRYESRGIDSIRKIVNTYAPESDGNNTGAYMQSLSRSMGVGVNDTLDLSDGKQLRALVKGITAHENAGYKVSDAQITAGTQGTTVKSSPAWADDAKSAMIAAAKATAPQSLPGINSPIAGVQVGAAASPGINNSSKTSTSTSETTIGKIEVVTQATDARGISQDIGRAISQNGLAFQSSEGDS